MKTVLDKQIEVQQIKYYNAVVARDGKAWRSDDWKHYNNEANKYEYALAVLQSLLPAEQSQIEAAWLDGLTVGIAPDGNENMDASDYYLTTFTSPDGDKSKEK